MFVIGERINGMFKDIGDGIAAKDVKPVHAMAEKQLAGGADALDINVGTRVPKEERGEVMKWLVEATCEVTDKPLSIDNPSIDIVRAGIEAADGKVKTIINSTTGQQDKLDAFMKLAADTGSSIIGLAIDENGVASTADAKLEIGMRTIAAAMEVGLSPDEVYLDPIVLPVNCDQAAPMIVLETVAQFKMLSDPAPHIVVGLSNLSQGALERSLINKIFLTMAMAAGLDASIHDPLDEELMNSMITAEVLLNNTIYSNSYIQAYRQSK
ncbi:MAG: dihydropteroate synthase [Kiritimatiellia bacterium]|jgi:5-methyltetrahydrofolate corrinoid/iron sulfur protein methyltransferase|nr:dihydropteroate synthase [Kiritimatiellia bacterium]